MKNRRLTLLTALVVACFVLPCAVQASHYPLEAVPFIAPKDITLFKGAKVEETSQLLAALATPEGRKAMHKKTGVALETLLEYARLCDLLSIRGVGPKMARLLRLADVTGLEDLRGRDADALLKKMKQANDIHTISEILPGPETVADWVQQAKKLKSVLKP